MTEETQQPVEEKSEKEPQNNPVKINNTKREKCRPMTKVRFLKILNILFFYSLSFSIF